jgi:hypothetical protein
MSGLAIWATLLLVMTPAAWARDPPPARGRTVAPLGGRRSETVVFEIEPAHAGATREFVATHRARGKSARFRIEFDPPRAKAGAKDARFRFGTGRFLSLPGSDASELIADLRVELEAENAPQHVRRTRSLPFQFVLLGAGQSRASDGGFTRSPPGTRTVTKIFLGDDEDEVFFNYSLDEQRAEFSIKDSDYGDYLVSQLATVL